MPIYFQNPGEIDPRLITTLGVNVKEGENPVGFFGTGLKYAIAVLLREGQEVEIFSGQKRFSFQLVPETIRGKTFQFIQMTQGGEASRLGFTTEFGKNWTLAHAYRELYCNARDEGGEASEVGAEPQPGWTTVRVEGAAFEQVHLTRYEFLLNPKLIPLKDVEARAGLEVFALPSTQVFYRGISVMQLGKTSALRYNMLENVTLTEDRTVSYPFLVEGRIAQFITNKLKDQVALNAILTTECYEHGLDLCGWNCNWSEDFISAVKEAVDTKPMAIDERVKARYYNACFKADGGKRKELALTPEQKERLEEAKEMLRKCGFSAVDLYEIIPVESLGERVLGLAERKTSTIYLASLAFKHSGELVQTLLEEIIHLSRGVADETREMQSVLLGEIHRLMQELMRSKGKEGPEVPF